MAVFFKDSTSNTALTYIKIAAAFHSYCVQLQCKGKNDFFHKFHNPGEFKFMALPYRIRLL